jgi:hypothetical protein
VSFHWDRIPSHITEIDPDLDSVFPITGTQKEEFRSNCCARAVPTGVSATPSGNPQAFRISPQSKLGDLTLKIFGFLPRINPADCIHRFLGQILEPVRPNGKNSRSQKIRNPLVMIQTRMFSQTRSPQRLPDWQTARLPVTPKALQHQHPTLIATILREKHPPIPPPQPLIYEFLVGLESPSQKDFPLLLRSQPPLNPTHRDAQSPNLMLISQIEHSGELRFADLLGNLADQQRSRLPTHP